MSNFFECFVFINDNKYTIYLNKDINEVKFSDVYNEIIKIDAKQNISLETNTFEIYNLETNKYKRIQSAEQNIKYLSRIRVLLKPQSFKEFLTETKPEVRNNSIYNYMNPIESNSLRKRLNQNYVEDNSQPLIRREDHFDDNRFDDNYESYGYKRRRPDPHFQNNANHFDATNISQTSLHYPNDYIQQNINLNSNPSLYYRRPFRPSFTPISPQSQPLYTRRDTDCSFRSGFHESDIYSVNNQSNFNTNQFNTGLELSRNRFDSGLELNRNQFNTGIELNRNRFDSGLELNRNQFNTGLELNRNRFDSGLELNRNQFNCGVESVRNESISNFYVNKPDITENNNNYSNDSNIYKFDTYSALNKFSDSGNGLTETQTTLQSTLLNGDNEAVNEILINEGFFKKQDKKITRMVCRICSQAFRELQIFLLHIGTEKHKNAKIGKNLDEIDKRFLLEGEKFKDIDIFMAQRRELKKFDIKTKTDLVNHGIRLRDGIRGSFYLCLTCNESLNSAQAVISHYTKFLDPNSSLSSIDHTNQPSISRLMLNKEELENLEKEGIQKRIMKNNKSFICTVCENCVFESPINASQHVKSENHQKIKTGEGFKGLNRLLAIDTDKYNQIDIVLARISELKKIKVNQKEDFIDHGIRLMDGKGSNAYTCLQCNIFFEDLKQVEEHLEDFNKMFSTNDDILLNSGKQQLEVLEKSKLFLNDDKYFTNEGFALKNKKNGHKLYCCFCNYYFKDKQSAIYHISRQFHGRTKRGEILNPIDSEFTVKSDRIDELDICLARMNAMIIIRKDIKTNYLSKGIRLKDGIGDNAYICLKCNESISTEKMETGAIAFINHCNSESHKLNELNSQQSSEIDKKPFNGFSVGVN